VCCFFFLVGRSRPARQHESCACLLRGHRSPGREGQVHPARTCSPSRFSPYSRSGRPRRGTRSRVRRLGLRRLRKGSYALRTLSRFGGFRRDSTSLARAVVEFDRVRRGPGADERGSSLRARSRGLRGSRGGSSPPRPYTTARSFIVTRSAREPRLASVAAAAVPARARAEARMIVSRSGTDPSHGRGSSSSCSHVSDRRHARMWTPRRALVLGRSGLAWSKLWWPSRTSLRRSQLNGPTRAT